MKGDVRYTWFYVVLSLFTSAMLVVVLANNLFQLLVGWEVMGVCSYLLIGHWWEDHVNSSSAIKAFITTRVGDVPFMFGIFVLVFITGFTTSNIPAISDIISGGGASVALVSAAALLLFGGTIGKSAQFPLHVWLPDAMAGPTPVSALIHAATMVAAGVYLVGRLFIVFLDADPVVLQIVAIVAGITMLGAALMAFTQDDIKRVLAYSTISQLAYMIAGMSMGPAGRTGAFFHLFTHAFFKALLFLGSGAVIHAVHSNNERWAVSGSDADHALDDVDGPPRSRHLPWLGSGRRTSSSRGPGDRSARLFVVFIDADPAFYRRAWCAHVPRCVLRYGQPHVSPMTGPLIFSRSARWGLLPDRRSSDRCSATGFSSTHEARSWRDAPLGTVSRSATPGRPLALVGAQGRDRWSLRSGDVERAQTATIDALARDLRPGTALGRVLTNQHVIDVVVARPRSPGWRHRPRGPHHHRRVRTLKRLRSDSGGAEASSRELQWYAAGLFVGVVALAIVFIRIA
jgi:hypothetical protein